MPKRKDTPRPPDDQPTRPTKMSEVDSVSNFYKTLIRLAAAMGNPQAQKLTRDGAYGFVINSENDPDNNVTSGKLVHAKPTSSRGAGTRKRLQKGKRIPPPLPPDPRVGQWPWEQFLSEYEKYQNNPSDRYSRRLANIGDLVADLILESGKNLNDLMTEKQIPLTTLENTRLGNNLDFSDMSQLPRQMYNDAKSYLTDVEAEPNIYGDATRLKNQLYGGLNRSKNTTLDFVAELFDPRKTPLPFITASAALKELYDNRDAMGGASKNRNIDRGGNPSMYKHMNGKPQPLKYATPFKNKFSK